MAVAAAYSLRSGAPSRRLVGDVADDLPAAVGLATEDVEAGLL